MIPKSSESTFKSFEKLWRCGAITTWQFKRIYCEMLLFFFSVFSAWFIIVSSKSSVLCSMIKSKYLVTLNKCLFVCFFLVLIGISSEVSNVLNSKERNNFPLKAKQNYYDKRKQKSIQNESKNLYG